MTREEARCIQRVLLWKKPEPPVDPNDGELRFKYHVALGEYERARIYLLVKSESVLQRKP